MKVILKQVLVQHKASPFHGATVDILIENGVITDIKQNIATDADQVVTGNALVCTIGLCDVGTHGGEPGFEHIETVDSLTTAALAGGYTLLALMPDLNPITQTKSDIEYLKNHPDRNGVDLYPIGALSKDLKGQDFNEYLDMHRAGISCFSDGLHTVFDNGLLLRSLQYASHFNGLILHFPGEDQKKPDYDMHEGIVSTSLGLKGSTDIGEKTTLFRDIEAVQYTGGQIVEHCISSAGSIKMLKEFNAAGKNILASVPYLNLIFTDEDLGEFDSNFKVMPVLRTVDDRKALQDAITNGDITVIVTNHHPWDEEAKNLEFSYAKFGAIGLQTCISAVLDVMSDSNSITKILECFTVHPRKLLGVTIPQIDLANKANLCIIDLNRKWSFSEENNLSKSKNSPFLQHEFNSKVVATIHGDAIYFTT